MIEIALHQVDANLTIDPSTQLRRLRFVDGESGIVVRLDFPEEQALMLASALSASSIVVAPANAMPQEAQL